MPRALSHGRTRLLTTARERDNWKEISVEVRQTDRSSVLNRVYTKSRSPRAIGEVISPITVGNRLREAGEAEGALGTIGPSWAAPQRHNKKGDKKIDGRRHEWASRKA